MGNIQKGKTTINYRAFTRHRCEEPIRYATYDTEMYQDAKMYNKSEGGMYFETKSNTPPGSEELWIRMANDSPTLHAPEAHDGYRATVAWCRKITGRDAAPRYGVGVRFVVNVCDLCGRKVSYRNIRKTDTHVSLCLDCFERLGKMPGGVIKQSLENYLIRNVI